MKMHALLAAMASLKLPLCAATRPPQAVSTRCWTAFDVSFGALLD